MEALARPLLAHTEEPEVAGRLAWVLAHALMLRLRYAEALDVCGHMLNERALTLIWAARLRALQAMIMVTCTRFDEGQAAAAQAEADGTQAGDPFAVGCALIARSAAEHRHRRDEAAALATADRALALFGQTPQATHLPLLPLEKRCGRLPSPGHPAQGGPAPRQALAPAPPPRSPSA